MERITEISIAGPVSDGVPLPFIVNLQPTLIFFEPMGSLELPVELESRKPRQGTKPDPLQNARTVLNAFYPGSFPDPLRLPFDDEPVKTAPEPAPAAEPKPRGWYNLTEAAEHLNMTRRKLRALITQKRVRCTQIDSRNFIFTQADLDEFLATYKTKPRRI